MADRGFWGTALVLASLVGGVDAQQIPYDTEYPAVRYSTRTPTSPVERLRQSLARGEARLAHDPAHGYLRALLHRLDVPASSQMLVFSRTSLQEGLVGPETPRAIYFNDEVYVAWVQGGDELEIAALDRNLGPIFYTLAQEQGPRLDFERQTGLCLECHDGYGLTGGGVPHFLIGSGLTDERGRSAAHGGWQLTTHATPLARRWGGWYVTGTHGDQTHMGNVFVADPAEVVSLDPAAGGNLTDLSRVIDTGPYLTEHSDIVALLVAEHQIHVQNLLTRASWEARTLSPAQEGDDRIAARTEPLVRAMLFADEEPLRGPIAGTSGFRAEFEGRGPRDERGRSLREMDLERRLFRYPLSYVVYSEAFDRLPESVKTYVYRRVWEVLTDRDASGAFDHLSPTDRQAVLEILTGTRADFARWLAAGLAAR